MTPSRVERSTGCKVAGSEWFVDVREDVKAGLSSATRGRRGGRLGRRDLFLQCHGALQQAGEIVTQNLAAVPASPQSVLRVEIIEIDAPACAHDLKPRAASLNNLDILSSHRKVHHSSSQCPLRLRVCRCCCAHIVPDCPKIRRPLTAVPFQTRSDYNRLRRRIRRLLFLQLIARTLANRKARVFWIPRVGRRTLALIKNGTSIGPNGPHMLT